MDRIILHVYYNGENGAAETFVREMAASGIQQEVKAEAGCLQYDYFVPVEGGNTVLLLEGWKDAESLSAHSCGEVMKKIKAAKEKYGVITEIEKYC